MTNMRFLVDESVGNKFANIMEDLGYDTLFVGEIMPEVDDASILFFAEREVRVLITADKDFGELIFKLGTPTAGVILLRTLKKDPQMRFDMIKGLLDKAKGKFIVVEEGHTRIRDLK